MKCHFFQVDLRPKLVQDFYNKIRIDVKQNEEDDEKTQFEWMIDKFYDDSGLFFVLNCFYCC